MTDQHLYELCDKVRALVTEVALFLRQQMDEVQHQDVEVKSRNSLVSYVDKEAEKQLVTGLQAILPESVFLTEEETIRRQAGTWRWIIDPLDGTTNYLHHLPCYSISIALQQNETTVLGIVHEVAQDEQFYASRGRGAYCNGRPIQVANTTDLADCLIATGFPYYDFSRMDEYMALFRKLMRSTRGVRRFGSAAVDLAYVACGRFDAFFEHSLHPWDVAAGAFLVQEAGGQVADFSGSGNYLHGGEMVAASHSIWPTFRAEVQHYLSGERSV